MIILCGDEFIDINQIISLLEFCGYDEDSNTPSHFIQLLTGFQKIEIRKLIEYITGQCNISLLEKKKIIIQNVENINLYPISHVCHWQMDLPDYNNYDVLQTKVNFVMNYIDHNNSFLII
jgi:hypothetical protein